MTETEQQQPTTGSHLSLYLKCSAILLLLSLSVLVMACGASNTTNTADLGNPKVTVTIRFNNNTSPTPTVAPYLCGAWTTNTTPAFNPGRKIPVYAHFVHNVNGNPVGVSGANAQATVEWADGYRDAEVTTTGGDGLAVFYFTVPDRPNMVNKNNLVLVSFTGPNGEACKADNQPQPAAYFTLITAPPTPTPTPPPIVFPTIPDIQGGNPPFLPPFN
ncbi:MAG TPA: hypothetical protein VHV10_05825 [Ktedonobacteraceae bacterium]|jgi:hypothetical protein|nr:hypothetical protein [Ktedonobacteraceae bacterium]